jgi:TetR/AcrR family transcriptional regulator, transcriptional repressor for nem operon
MMLIIIVSSDDLGLFMRITKLQATENRARVVETATAQLREKGLGNVGVADVMNAAGMTHGGFYNHFASKTELEAEACAASFEPVLGLLGKISEMDEVARNAAMQRYFKNYLSAKARDETGPRCPMVAFAGDVSRQDELVRSAYAQGLKRYLETFSAALNGVDKLARATAIQQFSTLVGALTLARSVAGVDEKLSDEILKTVREKLLD